MKKLFIFTLFLLTFLFIIPVEETKAFSLPPSTQLLSTTIVDVGLNEEIISFTKLNGDYGLDGLSINGFYAYAHGTLEGAYDYFQWAVVQNEAIPFKLYVATVAIETATPIYFVRFNYNASLENSYITFLDYNGGMLLSYSYDNVNPSWVMKRTITGTEGYLEALNEAYNNGVGDGYEQGLQDMHDNGSTFHNFDPATSFDFNSGYSGGRAVNVNAGISAFMEDFDKWIVIAILLVLLIGGSITVARRRNSGE